MRWPTQRVFLLLFILLVPSIPISSQADTFTGKVVRVAEGDAISVMREGRAVKVRQHGIDCPEKKQAFDTRAKQYTSEMAFGNEVEVQIKTTDRYGRIVGVVILPDGKNLNWGLVGAGLVWWKLKVNQGDSETRTVTVANNYDQAVVVTAIGMGGRDASLFTLSSVPTLLVTVQPSETITFNVTGNATAGPGYYFAAIGIIRYVESDQSKRDLFTLPIDLEILSF